MKFSGPQISLVKITHNFNLQLQISHSCFLTTSDFHIQFGLGHYHTIAEHQNFPPCTTAKFVNLSSPLLWMHRALSTGQLLDCGLKKIYFNRVLNIVVRHCANNFFHTIKEYVQENIHRVRSKRTAAQDVFGKIDSQRTQGGRM